jgi:NADH dehydrogenase
MRERIHAITGAFGYSGRHLAAELLHRGRSVRNLTGHPRRPDPFGGRVALMPFRFGDAAAMREALRDVEVLYNTYWVRFDHGPATFEQAVARSAELFRAASDAGVERVVHVSITNPDEESPLPYFRGKARVERLLRESGLSYAILRPAVFFGGRDVLINNIAWLLRRLPLFGVARGEYGIQPIHVDDMARLAAAHGAGRDNTIVDAVGPESFHFVDLVRRIAREVGSRSRLVTVPAPLLLAAASLVGRIVRDVVLTRHEIEGLRAGLLVSRAPPTGTTRFSHWLAEHRDELGAEWASELERHYR